MNINKMLSDNETVVKTFKASIVPFLLRLIIGAAVLIFGIVTANSAGSNMLQLLGGFIIAVVGIFILILSLTKLEAGLTTHFYITDRRIILQSRSRTTEMPIELVSGVTIDVPILGNMFNYGTVVIQGGAFMRAAYIKDPYALKNSLNK